MKMYLENHISNQIAQLSIILNGTSELRERRMMDHEQGDRKCHCNEAAIQILQTKAS
jgi:hypothetical protein